MPSCLFGLGAVEVCEPAIPHALPLGKSMFVTLLLAFPLGVRMDIPCISPVLPPVGNQSGTRRFVRAPRARLPPGVIQGAMNLPQGEVDLPLVSPRGDTERCTFRVPPGGSRFPLGIPRRNQMLRVFFVNRLCAMISFAQSDWRSDNFSSKMYMVLRFAFTALRV